MNRSVVAHNRTAERTEEDRQRETNSERHSRSSRCTLNRWKVGWKAKQQLTRRLISFAFCFTGNSFSLSHLSLSLSLSRILFSSYSITRTISYKRFRCVFRACPLHLPRTNFPEGIALTNVKADHAPFGIDIFGSFASIQVQFGAPLYRIIYISCWNPYRVRRSLGLRSGNMIHGAASSAIAGNLCKWIYKKRVFLS